MNLLTSFFPLFFVAVLGLALWSLYEQSRFTRTEGNTKRGVMVWAEPISWETRDFLETLPPITRYNNGFIRKQGREVLIAEERSFWQTFLVRRRQWAYVGYVNLSAPDRRLEFRMPVSTLASLVIVIPIILIISFGFFPIFFRDGFQFSPFCLFPIIFLAIFVGSILFNHYRERRRLLDILNQAMRDKPI